MATPKPPSVSNLPVLVSIIEQRIYLIRGKKVMLSNALAELYQVEVRTLVQAIKRNVDRFRPISCFSSIRKSTTT